ncbi:MAG: hypothetical protein V4541_09635 [Bacteroidota bacterium]
MEFKYTVFVACLGLLAYLLYKELNRPDRSFLAWRILASIVIAFALAAMVLPITYSLETQGRIAELNLITPGAMDKATLPARTPLYTLDSSLKAHHRKLIYLPDLGYYLQGHPEIKKVKSYGYGLSAYELDKLAPAELVFYPAPIPSGFIACTWSQRLNETESLNVQGTYHNERKAAVKLMLTGMGLAHDSLLVKPGDQANFSLNAQPKQLGNGVYRLLALQQKDTLSAEPIPFTVIPKREPKILILASAPDFEYKFLKKWLFEQHYQLIMRTRTSKGKYSTDFLNTKEMEVKNISTHLLKDIDLLVLDERELTALSNNEKAAITQSINNGMGRILRIDDLEPDRFNRYEILPSNEKPLAFKLENEHVLAALPQVPTLFLKADVNSQPLLTNQKGLILVNSQLNGMGININTVLPATYSWQLMGNKADYATFWASLFTKAIKKIQTNFSFRFAPSFFTAGQRTRLVLDGVDNEAPIITINGQSLSRRQNMELPFEWDAVFWPKQQGWNELKIGQETDHFYVYKKDDWQNLKNTELIALNRNFMATQPYKRAAAVATTRSSRQEISKWWFFTSFLLAASFLWYEQRFLKKEES